VAGGRGFRDEETALQVDPAGEALRLLRRCPQARWTDAAGRHAVTIEARAVAGSSPAVELVLDDPAVSRLHAELEPREDGVWVRDLGSRNGTWVEGVLVSLARVPERARVRLGSTTIEVAYAPEPTAVDLWPGDRFGPLLGRSTAMRELFARLARVAATDSTVLIQGETGTGKELAARAIHEASPRAAAPFAVVDCAALPDNLLEAELFGHAKGAFTGATASRAGALEAADGGTVLFDEIAEMPLSMQPKLLRAIESRSVRRIGETGYRAVNVRFLSSTHRDLRWMVNQGAFREDLFFRLAVVPITVPPLRARPEDIAHLAAHFFGSHAAVTVELGRELGARAWVGNVRELRNFVERARAFGAREALALTPDGRGPGAGAGERMPPVRVDVPFKELREQWLDHLEREYLRGMIARHGRAVSTIADAAGLDRTYIHRLLRKHDL
jgi:DNA-binding NtrC family response regulator